MAQLSNDELARYSRQIELEEWSGTEGQLKLKGASVLVVGAGAVGASAITYLASAGVGNIRICDGDTVEMSDLNRQVLFRRDSIGKPKASEARRIIEGLNDSIRIEALDEYFTDGNGATLIADIDLICCTADESDAKLAVGRHAYEAGIPIILAGTTHMAGFITYIDPPATPCIECILKSSEKVKEEVRAGRVTLPKDKAYIVRDEKPIPNVGAAAGTAGSIQAMEALKYLVGFGVNLIGVMLQFDMHSVGMSFNVMDIDTARAEGCGMCVEGDD